MNRTSVPTQKRGSFWYLIRNVPVAFIGAMFALVLARSLVLLFVAWELVGLASYLLIAFDYRQAGAPQAASKAFLMTRLGDVGLLLGWLLAVVATGHTDIDALIGATQSGQLGLMSTTLIAFLILAGALGKSAQLPLTGWLPDAMIGPTPVSALIHSATMVAAGVFLVLRLYPLFAAAPAALAALAWIGAATALFAALVATAENDLKRVLAWSTCSHLGEMMLALGLGGAIAAAFHLATHAAYKSTLFLAAGSVQESAGTRNLDKLGGLIRALPFTGGIFLVGALALAGIPPLSGFWSEDAILGVAEHRNWAAAALVVLISFLAGLYISRVTAVVFFGSRATRGGVRDSRGTLLAGMLLLAAASAILGWLLNGRIEALLRFGTTAATANLPWRLIAGIAAVAGLALGVMRAQRGSAPALGMWSGSLGPALMAITAAPTKPVLRMADGIAFAEHALDRAAEHVVATTRFRLAGGIAFVEHALDRAAESIATAAWRLAGATDRVEGIGFGSGGDRFAATVSLGVERLRPLQSGKIYLYTLGLFLWAVLALGAAGLVLWF